jgi:hypothetical protein
VPDIFVFVITSTCGVAVVGRVGRPWDKNRRRDHSRRVAWSSRPGVLLLLLLQVERWVARGAGCPWWWWEIAGVVDSKRIDL